MCSIDAKLIIYQETPPRMLLKKEDEQNIIVSIE